MTELVMGKRRKSTLWQLRWICAIIFIVLMYFEIRSSLSIFWDSLNGICSKLYNWAWDAVSSIRDWLNESGFWEFWSSSSFTSFASFRKSFLQLIVKLLVVWFIFYNSATVMKWLTGLLVRYIHIPCGLITAGYQIVILLRKFNWMTLLRFLVSILITVGYFYCYTHPP